MRKIRTIPRVVGVEVWRPYGLAVTFDDGLCREVDRSTDWSGPMAEPLRDPDYFALADVEHSTVVWPNGLDLDPLVLHGDFAPAGAARARTRGSVDILRSGVTCGFGRVHVVRRDLWFE